jgi:excisionase family DNA binding protein
MNSLVNGGPGSRYLGGYRAAASYSEMSVATLRKLVEDGRLKAYRPTGSRKVVFDRGEIDRLIHDSATAQSSGHTL